MEYSWTYTFWLLHISSWKFQTNTVVGKKTKLNHWNFKTYRMYIPTLKPCLTEVMGALRFEYCVPGLILLLFFIITSYYLYKLLQILLMSNQWIRLLLLHYYQIVNWYLQHPKITFDYRILVLFLNTFAATWQIWSLPKSWWWEGTPVILPYFKHWLRYSAARMRWVWKLGSTTRASCLISWSAPREVGAYCLREPFSDSMLLLHVLAKRFVCLISLWHCLFLWTIHQMKWV